MSTQIERKWTAPNGECTIEVWTFESDDDRRSWLGGRYATRGRGHVLVIDDEVAGTFQWREYPYDAGITELKGQVAHFNKLAAERGWSKEVNLY